MNFSIEPLQELLQLHADESYAVRMASYMRDQFYFHGIQSPKRKLLLRQFLKEFGKPKPEDVPEIVTALWALPQREYQYIAMELLVPAIKHLSPDQIPWVENLVVTKSWWDTVDCLASQTLGSLLIRLEQPRNGGPDRWIASDNFWLQRCALIFQLRYKQQTDADLLFEYIGATVDSREFFIQKAIGWALRQYSKTDGDAVIRFVESNSKLAPLSRREALKWLARKDR